MRLHFISCLLAPLMMAYSCRSGKEPVSKKDIQTDGKYEVSEVKHGPSSGFQDTVPLVWSREEAQNGPDRFRLVVVFISKGEGTDPQARSWLESFLSDFAGKYGKRPAYVMIPWGREGEVDCCFMLNELSELQKGDFVNGLKKSIEGKELIQVYEDAKNRFKP